MTWKEIKRIEAYKKDQFIQDCACLVLALGDGSSVELNENLAGWSDVVNTLPRVLPGCVAISDWWGSAAADSNWRTIFYRYSISGMGGKSAMA